MSTLVVGDDAPFGLAHHQGPESTKLHTDQGILEAFMGDEFQVTTSGTESSFVDEVSKIGTTHTGSKAGQAFKTDFLVQGSVPGMHSEYSLAAGPVGKRDGDVAVKTTRTQQRFIKDIDPVGSSQHHNSLACIEPIKFDQQLVERLVTFIIANQAHGTLATHSIDFIDEYDTGGRLARLVEEVTHAAGSNADKHFNEFRSAHTEERYARFARHCLRQQRLTCSGRTNQ